MKKHKQNRNQLDLRLHDLIRYQLLRQLREQLLRPLREQLSGQLSGQLDGQLSWQLSDQLYNQLKGLQVEEVYYYETKDTLI